MFDTFAIRQPCESAKRKNVAECLRTLEDAIILLRDQIALICVDRFLSCFLITTTQ